MGKEPIKFTTRELAVFGRQLGAKPKAEEPKAEEPKVDEPKVDEPKADEPKVDEPKVDETKAGEPKAEPKAELEAEPKADSGAEPKAEPKAKLSRDKAKAQLRVAKLTEAKARLRATADSTPEPQPELMFELQAAPMPEPQVESTPELSTYRFENWPRYWVRGGEKYTAKEFQDAGFGVTRDGKFVPEEDTGNFEVSLPSNWRDIQPNRRIREFRGQEIRTKLYDEKKRFRGITYDRGPGVRPELWLKCRYTVSLQTRPLVDGETKLTRVQEVLVILDCDEVASKFEEKLPEEGNLSFTTADMSTAIASLIARLKRKFKLWDRPLAYWKD